MAQITSRALFRDYIKRQLGYPVVSINVTEDQINDRIDDALQYFKDYHFDGSERIYLKHEVTAETRTNQYISLDENIFGVVRVLPIQASTFGASQFSARYQIALATIGDIKNYGTLTSYHITMTHLALLDEFFGGHPQIRFNRHTDRLYIDADWANVPVGTWLVIEAHRSIDENTYTDVWNDRWLKKYATALVKRQWGENMKKFEGIQMAGGITMNRPNDLR